VDCVLEAAGNAAAFKLSLEALRPGGEVVWLGKVDVEREIAFRWGSMMQERRIRRSSYGSARPARDFPLLVIWNASSLHYKKGAPIRGEERLWRTQVGEAGRSHRWC